MSATPPLRQRVDAVTVGTSAGGVDALSTLLPALPPGLAVPVFVVLHLPRERPSLLVDIFQRQCRVPVREAIDKEPVDPGVVYFAPPDYHLLIDEGPTIALSADELVHFSRPAVDVLFESAADVYGPHLLGIVLTGASHDGAAGLAAVARAGGITVVQDPETAYAPVMIAAAIERQAPDHVLPLPVIARLLGGLDATSLPSGGDEA